MTIKTPLLAQAAAYSFDQINFSFDEGLVSDLTSLARKEDVPLSTVLLTAYQVLLGRYCNTAEIDVNLYVAAAHHHTATGTIISSEINGTTSFRKLLPNVHTALQNASDKSDTISGDAIPLTKRLQGLRDPHAVAFPSFTAGFAMDGEANAIGGQDSGCVVPRQMQASTTCEIELHLDFSDTKLAGQLFFREDFFAPDTMSRFAAHFQVLLAGVAQAPDAPTASLAIMSQEESDTVVHEWNKTDAPWPSDKCIHHLFEAQAEATPSRTALIDGERQITYAELYQEIQELAARLVSLGVGADVPVALLLERSAETVVAIYSVLRAGGFYVPIDTQWPVERSASIMADANPPVLLTRTEHLHKISEDYGGVVLCMDALPQHTVTHVQPTHPPMPASAVYCLYTSGTSGKPKGAVVEHRGLVKRIQWFQDQYPLTPDDRVLNKTSYGFGISEWEYFWALPHGATLVIASPEGHRDPAYLHSMLVQDRISVCFFVPSMLNMLLQYMAVNELNDSTFISRLFTCGEALMPKTCSQFFTVFDNSRLINLYGPTEADMTYWECPRLEPGELIEKIPIGKPMSNVKVYILDEHMQPVPVGVPGELHFGGANTARGYLNRPTLTATKFIQNPFAKGRLYKTGDVAQWLPDGNIEFLGRVDDQVKIRGFRIELGEIETVLSQHPAVQETVVLAREDEPKRQQLVAYVVAKPEQTLVPGGLRKFLAEKLPDYMIPSVFVVLESLPLTHNGKINRQALPPPDQKRPGLESAFMPPRTPLEKMLAGIWGEFLGFEQVGIQDNFFELGGHSLLAAYLFAKIQEQLGRKLPLALLLQAPTIEQLAEILHSRGEQSAWSSLVPIQPKGSRPPLFFVHDHGGNVIGYYALACHLGPEQPFYGLQAQGLDGITAPFCRFEDMVAHYIKEIRTVQPHGPYYIGGWCLGGYVALETARQLQAEGECMALVVMVESPHPDYPKYLPSTGTLRRHFYRVITRLDLETSNFLEVESGKKFAFISERCSRLVNNTVRLKFAGTIFAPGETSPANYDVWQVQKAVEQAHAEAYRAYRPQPYEGAVAIFRAAKQPLGIYPDPTLGWGKRPELDLVKLPGHRIGLLTEPRVRITAGKIKNALIQHKR